MTSRIRELTGEAADTLDRATREQIVADGYVETYERARGIMNALGAASPETAKSYESPLVYVRPMSASEDGMEADGALFAKLVSCSFVDDVTHRPGDPKQPGDCTIDTLFPRRERGIVPVGFGFVVNLSFLPEGGDMQPLERAGELRIPLDGSSLGQSRIVDDGARAGDFLLGLSEFNETLDTLTAAAQDPTLNNFPGLAEHMDL